MFAGSFLYFLLFFTGTVLFILLQKETIANDGNQMIVVFFLESPAHSSLSDSQQCFQGSPSKWSPGDKLRITSQPRWHPSHSPATDPTAIGRQSDSSHSCLLLADSIQGQKSLNSYPTCLDTKHLCITFSLLVSSRILFAGSEIEGQRAITLTEMHLSLLTVSGTALQLGVYPVFFCAERPASSSYFPHTTLC